MGALADGIADRPKRQHGPRCGVCALIDRLDDRRVRSDRPSTLARHAVAAAEGERLALATGIE